MRIQRSEELIKAIGDLIVERSLKPGDPMPTEASLAEDLDASRNSVREAVKALQALGIVEVRHGYGTFVGSAGMDVLRPWLLFRTRVHGGEDHRRLRDLLELREILDTELTRRVTVRPVPGLTERLAACVERMGGATEELVDADREFHQLISSAAGSPLASELSGLFWDVYTTVAGELGPVDASHAAIAKQHRSLVAAIESGDPDLAELAVHQHFAGIRARLGAGPYGSLDQD